MSEEILLDIEGMTCASCVHRLERALGKQPSVIEARVSLVSRTAVVRCASADPSSLIRAVEQAGYGARLHVAERPADDEIKDYQLRLGVAALCSAWVLAFSLVVAPDSRASAVLAWFFATPVLFFGGWPILRGAARAARHRTYTMDTLIACGSLAAYAYSVGAVLTSGRRPFFETSALIVTLVLLGRVVESRARAGANGAVRALLERRLQEATRIRDGQEQSVPVADLVVGDRVVVLPGGQMPADGRVLEGHSWADLSFLTGESVPVEVGPGDEVIGGSLNVDGRIIVDVVRVGDETRLAEIIRLLELTQASKAPIQRLADRVSAIFVPYVLTIAAVVFVARWFFADGGLGEALLYGAAVLLVACPCSLGLATPVAIMAGSARGAERGILFKGGEVFETARRIDTVLIDKTGTLTQGSMSLTEVAAVGIADEEALAVAAAAEEGSEHPIARCIRRAAADRGVPVPEASDHRSEPGMGITARLGESVIRVGRPVGLPSPLASVARRMEGESLTVFAVWRDAEPIALLGTRDLVKDSAAPAVERLRRQGLDVAVVSGDAPGPVRAAARQAGVERTIAGVFPEGKVGEVKRLQAEGRRVAFVGDGINDAPALAQADLGIALGTGTDVAMEAGHVLIMGGDLELVAECLELSRRTFWVIAENLCWAFAYNALMIPLAVVGRVAPLVASAAMAGSSLTVVGNALRLRRSSRRAGGKRSVDDAPPVEDTDAPALGLAMQKPGTAMTRPAEGRPGGFARQERQRILSALGRFAEQQWEM